MPILNVCAYAEHLAQQRPWLIVGKGPSVDRAHEVNPSLYSVLTLNDACCAFSPDLAHFTDLDAYQRCREYLVDHPVCMPWLPHVNNKPGAQSLAEIAVVDAYLTQLMTRSLLFSYNSSLMPRERRKSSLPLVRVRYFSGVAAVNLLAQCPSVKVIHTIGLDCGKAYSTRFSRLTPLTNGRSSFDDQRGEFALSQRTYGVKLLPI